VAKTKKNKKFGDFIASCPMKNGSLLEAYQNGSEIYLVLDGKIEKTLHVENYDEVFSALMEVMSNGKTS
jgi:hypothetical protein